jgi:two-component system, LytTR family, response regulator
MKFSCIVVEDEPLAAERLVSYIAKFPVLDLKAQFENGTDALVYLSANKVDLIFLDINIGEISGIQLLETLRPSAEIIITTAYNEYALKGFDLNVTDYLLKPYTFERFAQAIARVQEQLAKQNSVSSKNFIFLKTEYRLEKIFFNEILYIEGMRDYRKVHAMTRKIMTLQTFKDLEEEIPNNIICRVHKSFMVAIDKVDSIEKDSIRIGNMEIPISDTYKKEFFQIITQSKPK